MRCEQLRSANKDHSSLLLLYDSLSLRAPTSGWCYYTIQSVITVGSLWYFSEPIRFITFTKMLHWFTSLAWLPMFFILSFESDSFWRSTKWKSPKLSKGKVVFFSKFKGLFYDIFNNLHFVYKQSCGFSVVDVLIFYIKGFLVM